MVQSTASSLMSYLSLTASSGAALQNWQEAWGAECRPPWHICLGCHSAALGLLHEGIVLDPAAGLVTSQGKTLGSSQPHTVLRRKEEEEKGTCAREAKATVGRHVCINKTNCPAWQWLWFCCLHLFFPGYPSLQMQHNFLQKATEQTSSNRRNFPKCLSPMPLEELHGTTLTQAAKTLQHSWEAGKHSSSTCSFPKAHVEIPALILHRM